MSRRNFFTTSAIIFSVVVVAAASLYFAGTQVAISKGFEFTQAPSQPTLPEQVKQRPPESGELPFFPNVIAIKENDPDTSAVELLTAKVQQAAKDGAIAEAVKELGIEAPLDTVTDSVIIRPYYAPEQTTSDGKLAPRQAFVHVDVKIGGKIDEALAYDLSTMLVYKLKKIDSRLVSMVSDRPPFLVNEAPRVPVKIIEELQEERDAYISEITQQ